MQTLTARQVPGIPAAVQRTPASEVPASSGPASGTPPSREPAAPEAPASGTPASSSIVGGPQAASPAMSIRTKGARGAWEFSERASVPRSSRPLGATLSFTPCAKRCDGEQPQRDVADSAQKSESRHICPDFRSNLLFMQNPKHISGASSASREDPCPEPRARGRRARAEPCPPTFPWVLFWRTWSLDFARDEGWPARDEGWPARDEGWPGFFMC